MAGLSATGLSILTIDEIKGEIEAELKSKIDPSIDVSATSTLGQVIGVFSERERLLWLLLRDVYTAFTPGGASGQSLAELALITGTKKQSATYSTVTATVNLNATTPLPLGSRANVSTDPTAVFETIEFVENTGGSPANFPVAMRAVEPGPVRANAGTLTQITTAVTGWNTVTNALDAEMGLPDESDQDLRERREAEIRVQGSSNLDAILADVRTVSGVVDAVGEENTALEEADGIPGKAFRIVLWDGTGEDAEDDEIAQAIWASKPAGIESFGGDSGDAVSAVTGDEYEIFFDRAEGLEVWLEVDVELDSDLYPDDGDEQIQNAITAWADERWRIGSDVILSALYGSIFGVSGVVRIDEIRAGFSASPTLTDDLSVSAIQKALADSARILVTDVS